jgi:hypothetical protein
MILRGLFAVFVFFASTVATAQTTHRIVTLAPHLAQLAHSAGVGRHVVGGSEYTPTAYIKTASDACPWLVTHLQSIGKP